MHPFSSHASNQPVSVPVAAKEVTPWGVPTPLMPSQPGPAVHRLVMVPVHWADSVVPAALAVMSFRPAKYG